MNIFNNERKKVCESKCIQCNVVKIIYYSIHRHFFARRYTAVEKRKKCILFSRYLYTREITRLFVYSYGMFF